MAELHIDLLDGYWVGVDKLNYILKKTYVSEKVMRKGKEVGGELVTKDVGYYKTPWDAVQKFLNVYSREHSEGYSGDLAGYAKFIEEKQNEAIRRLSVVWNASEAKRGLE